MNDHNEKVRDTRPDSLGKALAFLDQLETLKLWYQMIHIRESLMIVIAVPGERWEVEFFDDGSIDIERFISTGEVDHLTDQALQELLAPCVQDA